MDRVFIYSNQYNDLPNATFSTLSDSQPWPWVYIFENLLPDQIIPILIEFFKHTMSSLPHDIIIDILLRLPVKSLTRFRCVSKQWRALISDPLFVKFHLNRAISDPRTNPSRLLTFFPFRSLDYESPSLFEDEVAMEKLVFPLKEPGEGAKVMGSCNGLVCLLYHPNTISLWNPSTKASRELPMPPCSSSDISFYGIGYDSSIDDYKVVLAARSNTLDKTQVMAFNLKGNSWRGIEQGLHSSITISDDIGTFLNGALHWRASRDFGLMNQEAIIALDLGKEKFRVIPQPDVNNEMTVSFHTLGVSQECLSLCSYSYGQHVGIWVMKEYGNKASWTRVASVKSNEFEFCDYMVPVCFTKKGELLVDLDGRQLVRHNIQEKTSKTIKNWSEGWFGWIMYVESLVSPHGKS